MRRRGPTHIPLLAPAFVIGLLLVGVPHWLMPYNQGSVTDADRLPGLIGVSAIAVMLVVAEAASARKSALAMALCLPAAVMIRVTAETGRDPTSHNLWPFEILIALMVSLPAVMPALLAGAFLRWSRR